MMERELVAQRLKEFEVQEFMSRNLTNVGHSHTVMKKTPLGEKVVIFASRPGLIVGRRGLNIKELTIKLKDEFKLENPQIEISEVMDQNLDADIVAEKIALSLERFGSQRFKGIGHKMMEQVMASGARGIEILLSGKLPSARARTWRFYLGYLKKSGDFALTNVRKAYRAAQLKSGTIGIQVRIMPKDLRLPDDVRILEPQPEEGAVQGQESVAASSAVQAQTKAGEGAPVEKAEGKEAKPAKKRARKSKKSVETSAEKSAEPASANDSSSASETKSEESASSQKGEGQ